VARKKRERIENDIRDYPCYSIDEVASYIGVPKKTLRNWITGYSYRTAQGIKQAPPVIKPADPDTNLLSFYNLVEAQVLAATKERNIGLQRIRRTEEFMREQFNEDRPLLRCIFDTYGQQIFLQSMSGVNLKHPLNVSEYGQYGFRPILKRYLSRIERDANGDPTSIFPMKAGARRQRKDIVIHPFLSAGKPALSKSGVMVETIWRRNKDGESITNLAKDFRLSPSEIKAALQYYAA
jgi:uncharacterized protein (DUF433 family)